jgi:L-threonylcarbamoyladenylate synthase
MIRRIQTIPIPEPLLSDAIDILDRGGIIAYPTETVYGLGCDALQEASVQRIFALKNREPEKSLLILIHSVEAIGTLAKSVSPLAERLMHAFWPGPLTLIFKSASGLPEILTGKGNRIGIRISPDPVCRCLLERFRRPLVSTSANPAGSKPARNARAVLDYFGRGVDLILDHGERMSTLPSTVLDVTRPIPVLVRQGPVELEALQNIIGDIVEKASV